MSEWASDRIEELSAENVALRRRVAELETACRCGARALRMHDLASPTAVELELASEDQPSAYRVVSRVERG